MRLIVFKQQMEKYALTSHYVVTGNSIGWKKEKPAIAELVRDSEKVLATALPSTNQISFEFLWFPPHLSQQVWLEQYKPATTLFIRRPHIVSPSVSPLITTRVQAPGSLTVVERLLLNDSPNVGHTSTSCRDSVQVPQHRTRPGQLRLSAPDILSHES